MDARDFGGSERSSFDLSSMNKRQLRELLNTSRERGEAGAAYKILQEMASRRESGGRSLFPSRKSSPPRMVDLDLGDPLDRRREPADEGLQSASEMEFSEPSALDWAVDEAEVLAFPSSLERPYASAPGAERSGPAAVGLAPAVKRLSFDMHASAVFTAGIALGAVLTWGLGEIRPPLPEPSSPPTPTAIKTAAVAAPAPAPDKAPPPPAPPAPVLEEPGPRPLVAEFRGPTEPALPASVPDIALPDVSHEQDAAKIRAAEAMEQPAPTPVKAHVRKVVDITTPSSGTACARESTPADKTICGSPKLQKLQRKLRTAYAEALEAHEDRDLLRKRQLAWRASRDEVSQPARLARIYEARIRKLNAATVQARRS